MAATMKKCKESKPAVLVVDDEPQVVEALGDTLEDDFEVLRAYSGHEGLEIIEKRRDVAVVLSDQRMPGETGDRFLARVRDVSSATRLLITGYADIDAVVNAVNNGKIFGYISKPWDAEDLHFVVVKALEHYQLELELDTERRLLHNLMDYSPDAIYFKDLDGRYLRVNRGQARFLGCKTPEEAVGKTIADFVSKPDLVRRVQKDEARIIRSKKPLVDRIFRIHDKRGQEGWYSMTKAPVISPDDQVSSIVAITRDVTERMRTEEALAEREAALRHSQALVGLGHRFWNGKERRFEQWSLPLQQILQRDLKAMPRTLRGWLRLVHKRDRAKVIGTYRKAYREQRIQTCEYHIRDGGENWRIIREVVEPYRSDVEKRDEGDSDRWFSTLQDVTDSRRRESEIRLLLEVTQAMDESEGFEEACQRIIRLVCQECGWPYGECWRVNPDSQRLEREEAWFGDHNVYRKFRDASKDIVFAKGEGLPGHAWQARTPIFLDRSALEDPKIFRRAKAFSELKLPLNGAIAVPVADGNGNVHGVLGFFSENERAFDEQASDIVNGVAAQIGNHIGRMQAQIALRDSEERFRVVAESIPGMLWRFVRYMDGSTALEYVSNGCEMLYGYSSQDILDNQELITHEAVHPEDIERYEADLTYAIENALPWNFEGRIVARNGDVRWISAAALPRNRLDGCVEWHGAMIDVTDQRETERKLAFVSQHDEATEFLNRRGLVTILSQEIEHDNKRRLALLNMRFEKYRTLLDSVGVESASSFLRECGRRIRKTLPLGTHLARGYDDCLQILLSAKEADCVVEQIERLLHALGEPIKLESHTLVPDCQIGVSLYPSDAVSGEMLLQHAKMASDMVESHRGAEFYHPEMDQRAKKKLSLEQRLRRAMESDELELHFQPQVHSRTGKIVACEALLRWPTPEGSFISPGEFIPVAEDSGLILPLGQWVLDAACRQIRQWIASGKPQIPIAINVSAHQFLDRDALEEILETVREIEFDTSMLKLELTESALVQGIDLHRSTLQELREAGVGIAIDDFGTGYSSLSYLKNLPIDILKIDKSFIDDIAMEPRNAAVVQTILTLAHGLGMHVVAEGVETTEQLSFLRAYNCDYIQGFLFYKPMPANELANLLEKQSGS